MTLAARSTRQVSAKLIVVASLVLLGGCSLDGSGSDALEGIGSRLIDEGALSRFVWRETGVSPELLDERAVDRLEDELVVELLFARAAEREGLEVPETRVVALATEWLDAASSPLDPADAHSDARRALAALTFEQERIYPLAAVSDEEIEKALGPVPRDRARDHVVFRQIRTEERQAADSAHERVTKKRESFESVARDLSSAPDRGAVQQRLLSDLPGRAGDVLARLPEGSVSKPVEVDGVYFMFQLEARNRDPDPGRQRERESVRERLVREKLERVRREAWERLAADEGVELSRDGAAAEWRVPQQEAS